MTSAPPIGRVELRTVVTADLTAVETEQLRAFLDDAFAGQFGADDWSHALGGVHVLATVDGDLAAHAAVVGRQVMVGDHTLRTGYVEAVATGAAWRRRGVGGRLMDPVERLVTGGFELGALAASDDGARLYERRGWLPWQGPLAALTPSGVVPTPEERVFVLGTPATPLTLDPRLPLMCDWRRGDPW
jgi:aminoglycoside 2'-N-acetyltransferase I